MNSPTGSAMKIITSTARMIAATMTGRMLTMPTAVITESSENTMSISAICAMTRPKLAEARLPRSPAARR